MALFWRAAAMLTGVALVSASCSHWDVIQVQAEGSTCIAERLTNSSVDKLDILLVIDTSPSMADKREFLAEAVPDLVHHVINPPCVQDDGSPTPTQPADPTADCPDGTRREHEPMTDVHIGVITSSLGGHGSDACDPTAEPTKNDRAHLITRDDAGGSVEGWNGKDFLVWDGLSVFPSHDPPGDADEAAVLDDLAAIVGGAGQLGCSYEAPLEAWYRFLIEPDPYDQVVVQADKAELVGTDDELLQQRAEFLRPDSVLAIVMLSDENDCSVRDGGQFYFAAQQSDGVNPYHLPRPRAACAVDPNDPCCRSCGQPAGDGCGESQDDCSTPLSAQEDAVELRCWDQKRRFGIDFLYPIDRYVTGLSSSQVTDRNGNVATNPLFTDLNPNDSNSAVRDAGLVFLTGIVGVPWQDIARQRADGTPDLVAGLTAAGSPEGGFKSGAEMATPPDDTWNVILGDPEIGVQPYDPLMRESVAIRTGVSPVTGDALTPPGVPTNPINGSEYTIANDDLQYACIFPLPTPRTCNDPADSSCECTDPNNDKPVCDPNDRTRQIAGKAYPGLRQLAVLKALGQPSQATVGSICPAQLSDTTLKSYGYRAAVGALSERLHVNEGRQCSPRLKPHGAGQVACRILEARSTPLCDCGPEGMRSPLADGDPLLAQVQDDPLAAVAGWNCFCELTQASEEDLTACQNDPAQVPMTSSGATAGGWCYIDGLLAHGNQGLVAEGCETEQRTLRFLGNQAPGATLFISCCDG